MMHGHNQFLLAVYFDAERLPLFSQVGALGLYIQRVLMRLHGSGSAHGRTSTTLG